MNYIRLHINIEEDLQELIIAELLDHDFEGFEQIDNRLIASIPSNRFDDTKREEIELNLPKYDAELIQEEIVEPQNWNEQWEQTIQPKVIGDFYIRPTWSETKKEDSDLIELLIDPKMAFGTGYHETTKLMLECISALDLGDKSILDAGTGTGILGIAALKKGAGSVFGFDIDEWSEVNARENIQLNQVSNFEVALGSTEIIPEGSKYDAIFANINKNALKVLIPELISFLKDEGSLLLSGLLDKDEEEMMKFIEELSLNHQKTTREGEWIAIHLTK